VAVRASQPFSLSTKKLVNRILDVAAVGVILFVAWKLLVAPRIMKNDAYPAPRIAYERLDGGTFTIAQERGHVLFLDFYASWCEPCKLQAPIVEAYAQAHPNVRVVPIDVGESRMLAERFAKQFHLKDVAMDPTSSAMGFFQINGFPTLVVIDPKGNIRYTWSGFNPAVALAMDNAEKSLQ
jgi:cytochrome c biogenesis protein CcmG/thiol:disulfide interchange protein DsbE